MSLENDYLSEDKNEYKKGSFKKEGRGIMRVVLMLGYEEMEMGIIIVKIIKDKERKMDEK